jgi:LmbE family N-acetylglucosaminyl deacetylase
MGGLDDLVGDAPFLVLAPHPDDETLGCGGLLAMATERGVAAHVVILTDGAASHPASRVFPPSRLAALRRDEARAAVARLGLPADRLTFLDLPDAAAPTTGRAFDDAVAAIDATARRVGAKSLFVTSELDPHCDHEAAHAMARAALARLAVRLWAYPVWSLHLDPDVAVSGAPPRGIRLDIGAQRDAKQAALRCYASQMTPLIDDDPEGFVFTAEQLAPFLDDFETFIEMRR